MLKTQTTKDFIEDLKKMFPKETYDFTETEYINSLTPITIKCYIHGKVKVWSTNIKSYINSGTLCVHCRKLKRDNPYKQRRLIDQDFLKRKYNTKTFIQKLKELYGKKSYDFSQTEFIGLYKNTTIKCLINPKHGEWKCTPRKLLTGSGCPKCKEDEARKKQQEKYAEQAKNLKPFTDITSINQPEKCGKKKKTMIDYTEDNRKSIQRLQKGIMFSAILLDEQTKHPPADHNIKCISYGCGNKMYYWKTEKNGWHILGVPEPLPEEMDVIVYVRSYKNPYL